MSASLTQVTGIAAGVLTSVALLPQVIKVYREKRSEQISMGYIFVLLCGQSLWIVYGFMKSDIPVIATNIFSMAVGIAMMVLGIRYKEG